ncbi:MAG TPA: hypothetical protein VME43_27995 [Bryobacteraceae bacterium]|nr:hypothetical protein [Bryobacteraceae bacterium]
MAQSPQYPPPPPQGALPPQGPPPPPQAPPGAPPAQPPYAAQGAPPYYPPQQYPTQQYPAGYPPQPYPPYPPQQYPTQQYPPQQYQQPQYPPPNYPPQYGPPQYAAPYPPQQSYPPPPPPRTDTAPVFASAPVEPPMHAEPVVPRTGSTLFGAAPVEQPVYAPPSAPRTETAAAVVAAPPEPSHEPGAPRAGGMLFGPSTPAEAAPRRGLPTWLMTILFAGGLVVVISGLYWLLGSSHSAAKPSTTVESPAAQPGAPTNVWQKYIEVSGIRFIENGKKEPVVKFILTNHAGEEAEGLAGNVTLWGRTRKSEEDAAGTFSFKTDVPANSTKELEAPLTTKLKLYELPDWQYVSADLQITAPGGSGTSAQ